MVGDLSRISKENKKLKEMLTVVLDNYNTLQTKLKKIIQDKEVVEPSPKKRKFDETVQQSLWKRPNEELPKSGIQRVYVQTDPSDKSLVLFSLISNNKPSILPYFMSLWKYIMPIIKRFLHYLLIYIDSEGWISMEKIRAKGY